MFTDAQFKQIESAWIARKEPQPLNRHCLEEVSRVVFYASLRREEERPIEVRVSVVDRASLVDRKCFAPSVHFLPIDPEPEFTVDAVVKMSGAMDTRNSSLIVVSEENKYFVAGIAFFGWRASYLDAEAGHCPAPHTLTLVARQPGQLLIGHADGVVARFIDGRISLVEPTPFGTSILSAEFERRIREHEGFKKYPTSYWGAYTACLERLLVLAESRGHGGTILWVPKDRLNTLADFVDVRRKFADSPDIAKSLDQILDADRLVHRVIDAHRAKQSFISGLDSMSIPIRSVHFKKAINEHLAMLAQLTRVDGALVIDEFLRPIGFSAVIKTTPEWTGPIVNMSRLTPGPVDLTKFGTRHRSAVTFVANCVGAIALVISQDGAVRGMVRTNDQVGFWPDCFGSVFLN